MTKKTVLILGMGHSQVDLALAAREYGANVFACARNLDGPARPYVDGCREIDITDVDGIVDYAREIKADVIFTLGLEIALEPMTQASERLGLNTFYSSETLDRLKDKVTWRKKLEEVQGNLRYDSGYKPEDFAGWDLYPAILKPSDSSGQRGVFRVKDFDEVRAHFAKSQSYSKSGLMIMEEFAEGDEISVNSFMEGGELKFAIISDRLSYQDLPGGIIKEHHIPSQYDHPPLSGRILDLVNRVNQVMGFENGHIYFQMKVHGQALSLIEFTPRFDGCHMWRLIRTVTGLDLLQVSLENLLEGKSRTLRDYQPVDLALHPYQLKFNSDKAGVVVDYAHYPVHPNAVYNYWYYREGQTINKITDILEKVGYYIFQPDKC